MDIKRIPTFPDYFCTSDGIILDKFFRPVPIYPINTQEPPFYPPWKVPKHTKKINPYKMVYLKRNSSDKRGVLNTVHSIVAKTWVANPRPDIFHVVDHIDRNEHNNHPSNLSWLTHTLNCQNNDGLNVDFVKTHKKNGKFFKINMWRSRVTLNGKCELLGMYKTFLEAYVASKKFKQENFQRNYKYIVNESPRACQYLFLDGDEDVASPS